MPYFGKHSLILLENLHQDGQIIAKQAITVGLDFSIIETARDKETHDYYLKKKLSKVPYEKTKHRIYPDNFCRAFHAIPYPIMWPDKQKSIDKKILALNRIFILAGILFGISTKLRNDGIIRHKLRWGGDWDKDFIFDDQTFFDYIHFELIE